MLSLYFNLIIELSIILTEDVYEIQWLIAKMKNEKFKFQFI